MKKLTFTLILLLGLLVQNASADLLVVVNEKLGIDSLTKSQIIDIYMGRHTKFPNGTRAQTFDHADGSIIKELFYKKLIGKSIAKVNAYWARLRFTGRSKPPKKESDQAKLIKHVQDNVSSIAYIDIDTIPTGLTVIYQLK